MMRALIIDSNGYSKDDKELVTRRFLRMGFEPPIIVENKDEAQGHIITGEFEIAIIDLDFKQKAIIPKYFFSRTKKKKNPIALDLLNLLYHSHPKKLSIILGSQPELDFFDKVVDAPNENRLDIDYLNNFYKYLKYIFRFDNGKYERGTVMNKIEEIFPKTWDIVIMTALRQEYNAVKDRFEAIADTNNANTCFATLKINEEKTYNIVISHQQRTGQGSASALSVLLCNKYKPKCVFLVGIAGAKKDSSVKLAHVLVAIFIIDTTAGETDEDENERIVRWRTVECDRNLLLLSKDFSDNLVRWNNITHHAPIFSGNDVIKDESVFNDNKDHWKKAVGVEMEGAGAATAISDYIDLSPKFLMIRGVSDFAGENKDKENKQARQQACDIAVAYTYAFLKTEPI